MPASAPSVSATGRWRMRWSVINHMSCSIVSLWPHVRDLAVMRSATLRSSAAVDRAPRPRTTSRSERMPSIVRPSEETTRAPTRRSLSRATARARWRRGDGRHLRPLRGQDALDVHRNLPEVPFLDDRLVSPTRQLVAGRTPHVSTGWGGRGPGWEAWTRNGGASRSGWRRTSSGGS